MWEIIIGCIAGVVILFMFLFLIGCIAKDRQISKEWERIFRKGDRND